MIKLPKFTTQSMYDSETDFNLQMNTERISKLLIHYEIFKKIIKVKGDIVECGIFKGTSFVRLGVLRELFKKKCKLIGFDVFADEYPNTNFIKQLGIVQFLRSNSKQFLIKKILVISS